jgi:TPR repeat protein
MYIQGTGVPRDYAEAEKWFRKAAEQGDHMAQSMLGSITKDSIEAYMWLTLSVAGSTGKQSPFFQQTEEVRATIAKKMNPQQIAEAQRRAKEWKPKKAE